MNIDDLCSHDQIVYEHRLPPPSPAPVIWLAQGNLWLYVWWDAASETYKIQILSPTPAIEAHGPESAVLMPIYLSTPAKPDFEELWLDIHPPTDVLDDRRPILSLPCPKAFGSGTPTESLLGLGRRDPAREDRPRAKLTATNRQRSIPSLKVPYTKIDTSGAKAPEISGPGSPSYSRERQSGDRDASDSPSLSRYAAFPGLTSIRGILKQSTSTVGPELRPTANTHLPTTFSTAQKSNNPHSRSTSPLCATRKMNNIDVWLDQISDPLEDPKVIEANGEPPDSLFLDSDSIIEYPLGSDQYYQWTDIAQPRLNEDISDNSLDNLTADITACYPYLALKHPAAQPTCPANCTLDKDDSSLDRINFQPSPPGYDEKHISAQNYSAPTRPWTSTLSSSENWRTEPNFWPLERAFWSSEQQQQQQQPQCANPLQIQVIGPMSLSHCGPSNYTISR